MSERNSLIGARRRRARERSEPSRRWWSALGFVFSAAIYYGLTADPPGPQNPALYTVYFVCLGIGGLLISAAEFLPRDRITPAGRLRIPGYALFWVFVCLILVEVYTVAPRD